MTVQSIIQSLRKGEYTKEEANRAMAALLQPKPIKKYQIVNPNGVVYTVTKERYEDYMKHGGQNVSA